MDELLDQIQTSVDSESYLLGLYVTLSLPGICGALESWNGRSTGSRYKSWFDKWVAPKYDKLLTGEQCYAYHCGLFYQGRSQHNHLGYSRLIFLEPNTNEVMHRNILNDAYNLDIKLFCDDMVASTREWLTSVKDDNNFINNYKYFIKRHENGIPPFVEGRSVIG